MTDSTETIETMAKALIDSMAMNDASLPVAMRDALRAAKADGWELVRLPGISMDDYGNEYIMADEIERLELEAES